MKSLLAIASLSMSAISLQASFVIPSWLTQEESENNELAYWSGFSDAYTDWTLPEAGDTLESFPDGEGNAPNAGATNNEDAVLIQNGVPSAFLTSTSPSGIYNVSGSPTEFAIYDNPTYSPGTVLFQVAAIGTSPDPESAQLLYRTEEGGNLYEAELFGTGYLFEDDYYYVSWEWDLSDFDIYDYVISFSSIESSMSLKEALLTTIDIPSHQLGYALSLSTNSYYDTIGEINSHLSGETGSQASYQIGDSVVLTASPNYDYVFSGWIGDISSDQNPLTVTMSEGLAIQAVFSVANYTDWFENYINPYIGDRNTRGATSADPDFNGLSNLMEYAFGGLPESSTDEADVRPQVSISDDGDFLQITFKRQPAATDITYNVLVSDDLESWHHNGDESGSTYTETLTESIVLNEDGTETVTVRDLTPISSGGARFMSVEVIMM